MARGKNASFRRASVWAMSASLAIAAGCICGCGGNSTARAGGSGAGEPLTAGSATMVVHGMSCPLCANNVDKQLREVPGVNDVKIDMASGNVKVAFAQGRHPSESELRRAIDGTGFTLKSFSTP